MGSQHVRLCALHVDKSIQRRPPVSRRPEPVVFQDRIAAQQSRSACPGIEDQMGVLLC